MIQLGRYNRVACLTILEGNRPQRLVIDTLQFLLIFSVLVSTYRTTHSLCAPPTGNGVIEIIVKSTDVAIKYA